MTHDRWQRIMDLVIWYHSDTGWEAVDQHGWHVIGFRSWSQLDDHVTWCRENLGWRHRGLMGRGSWFLSNRGLWRWDHAYGPEPERPIIELRFRRESDAVAFKLRWF